MRYAVPVSGGMVLPHFGHCENFALIDVDEDPDPTGEFSYLTPSGREYVIKRQLVE